MFPIIVLCRVFGQVLVYAIDNTNVWLADEKEFVKFMNSNKYYYSVYQDRLFKFVIYDAREKHCIEFERHCAMEKLNKKIDRLLD